MELYHASTNAEKLLCMKADLTHTPIGGTMELLPLCNMDCKMCYVRLTKEEMNARGRMLSCDEWLRIADEAVQQGLLFLLITGGEPLMYPEFKRLYATLSQKGLVLSVNTNGTLIDEEMADFFAQYGCRRLNITLYGKNDETYGALCRNPRGFTQVMNAAKLLKARDVPFRLTCSVTPQNIDDLPELYSIARDLDVPLQATSYMFPALRKGLCAQEQYRLEPEEAARSLVNCFQYAHANADMEASCRQTLNMLQNPGKLGNGTGFSCRAAHSGFWMNWKGEMLPCGMFEEPRISLLQHSFHDCWNYIVETCRNIRISSKCVECDVQNICQICPAACLTETGSTEECPEYLCRMTKESIRIMKSYISDRKDTQTNG